MAAFGPDRTKQIDFGGTHTILVPPTQRILLRFSFSAWWENAILLYSKQTLQLLAERGNYNRSRDDYITDNSGSDEPLELLVTAWHKKSPPKASASWHQSKRFKLSEGDHILIIGFNDDGQNHFYENAVVTSTGLT
jgi:hypothetical protein